MDDAAIIRTLREHARPLTGGGGDYNDLLDLVGDAQFVLLGAASHGTREFTRERARITRRLIDEKGFAAVAVEADWPEAARVNRYARSAGDDGDAAEALGNFARFPGWMWRNADAAEFVEWLRVHNDALPQDAPRVGFYGLDLYSLRAARQAVASYLDRIDPRAADRTRGHYACLDHLAAYARGYGMLGGIAETCKEDAGHGLVELYESRAVREERRTGARAEEEFFDAVQNARLVKDAEAYYRSMYRDDASTWNLRERHMAETVEDLVEHIDPRRRRAKIAVWAHSSHLGDARATDMRADSEVNVGQIMRRRHGAAAVLIGLTTHHGEVTAASDWETPEEMKTVSPALPDSYEALLHATEAESFFLPCRPRAVAGALRRSRRERAIGVVYYSESPDIERASHYFTGSLSKQFDAVLHFDETRAVEPLGSGGAEENGDAPETYPFGV